MVEHIGFKQFCSSLQPMFKMVSRNTIKSDIMKIYNYEKVKTMKMIEKNQSKIAFTTDMWTSSYQKRGYKVVTAYFINNAWKLQERILRYFRNCLSTF